MLVSVSNVLDTVLSITQIFLQMRKLRQEKSGWRGSTEKLEVLQRDLEPTFFWLQKSSPWLSPNTSSHQKWCNTQNLEQLLPAWLRFEGESHDPQCWLHENKLVLVTRHPFPVNFDYTGLKCLTLWDDVKMGSMISLHSYRLKKPCSWARFNMPSTCLWSLLAMSGRWFCRSWAGWGEWES